MTDLSALWDEDASAEDTARAYQALVNNGSAWRMEGAVGRAAMDMIEAGVVALGDDGHHDYWGNYVPSRHEVEAGTKGSAEFVTARSPFGEVLD
jgi:hypothetical protein